MAVTADGEGADEGQIGVDRLRCVSRSHVRVLVCVFLLSIFFRSSWGSNWGEDGYIRLPMGTNACGLANFVGQA